MKIFFNLILMLALTTFNVWAEKGASELQAIQKRSEAAALNAIQKRYESVNTFRAHFIQRAYIKLMDQAQESEGEVAIKKPGKMIWTYKAPDPHILVSNNKTLWLYAPEENQVTKASVENIYTNNTPAIFLSGKGKLAEAFRIEKVSHDSDILSIFLIPNENNQDLKQLTLMVNDKNYQIVGSRVYDRLGNKTEILFSNIEINVQLSDSLFEFEAPEGVELLDTTVQPK